MPCFMNCGIVVGDDGALQETLDKSSYDPLHMIEIKADSHFTGGSQVMYDDDSFARVYTDGSANGTMQRATARAGWGVCWGQGHPQNACALLAGPVQSSYRAEVRAILHVVPRAACKVRIRCDCKGVVSFFQKVIDGDTSDILRWPEADLWMAIRDALPVNPRLTLDAIWMPAHLDEVRNAAKKVKAEAELGITLDDVIGNAAADLLAKDGAAQHALSQHLVDEARDRSFLARHAHQMMVTIWQAREDSDKALKHIDAVDAAEIDDAWLHGEPEFPEDEDYNPFGLIGLDGDHDYGSSNPAEDDQSSVGDPALTISSHAAENRPSASASSLVTAATTGCETGASEAIDLQLVVPKHDTAQLILDFPTMLGARQEIMSKRKIRLSA